MLHTDLIAPIPELLRRHAAARGEKIAYRDAQTSVTYAGLLERTGKLAGHLADHGIAPGDTVAIMLPNSVHWVESCFAIARAGAVSVPISYDSTETEIAYRLGDANCKAVITTAERGDLFARLQASAPNLKTLIVTDRGQCGAHGTPLRNAGDDAAEIRATRSRVAARDLVHPLHLGHHRPRQGRAAHGARHVVDRRRLLGADHRPVRARHGALAAAAVSFLRAESVGARHPRHRRQRLHHGAVLDQRSGAAAQERRIHLLPRRADHVPLSVAGDARRDGLALSQSAALRLRRRHHAGDAQSRVRKSSGRAVARRLRHHRNLDHGDDELAQRTARARLMRFSGAGACGAHRRCQRPRRRRRTRKAS